MEIIASSPAQIHELSWLPGTWDGLCQSLCAPRLAPKWAALGTSHGQILESVYQIVGRRTGLKMLENVWTTLWLALLCEDPVAMEYATSLIFFPGEGAQSGDGFAL